MLDSLELEKDILESWSKSKKSCAEWNSGE